jgi:hypothetical protein
VTAAKSDVMQRSRGSILDLAGLRKWGKTKGKGDVGFETTTCLAARDVSEKYQSQIYRSLEH